MPVPFLTSINLNKNEIINVVLQNLASDPSNPVSGQIYFNTTDDSVRYYDGTAWVDFTSSISGTAPIQVESNVDGTVTISIDPATQTDPGSMSAADKVKLDSATAANTADTLVLRDASGNFKSAEPVVDADVANKSYVDSVASGLDVKNSVRAATTPSGGNLTLSGQQTVDGVSLTSGDRILVKDQTDASENGIYVVATGAWVRSDDADTNAEVTSGMFTFVEQGTTNADSGWVLTTEDTITLDTTDLAFVQFSGAGQITAGAGLTKSGNTIDVVGTADRITVNADSIDIASTYAGQSSIITVGTITTGVWQGTEVGVAYGGTGATTATGARTNLDVPGRYSATIGDDTNSEYTINHGLNTTDVIVFTRYAVTNSNAQVFMDVEVSDANNVVVRSSQIVTSTNQIRVTVIG